MIWSYFMYLNINLERLKDNLKVAYWHSSFRNIKDWTSISNAKIDFGKPNVWKIKKVRWCTRIVMIMIKESRYPLCSRKLSIKLYKYVVYIRKKFMQFLFFLRGVVAITAVPWNCSLVLASLSGVIFKLAFFGRQLSQCIVYNPDTLQCSQKKLW